MKKIITCVLVGMLFVLAGCQNSSDSNDGGISVDTKGNVSQVMKESFDQSYYNVDELKNEIQKKADEQNAQSGNEKAVVLDKVELSDDKVLTVKIKYASCEEFEKFNGTRFYNSTVAKAYEEGIKFPDMKSADGSESLSSSSVLEKGEYNLLITDENTQITVPYKIAYISSGASIVGEKSFINLNVGDTVYVLYKK